MECINFDSDSDDLLDPVNPMSLWEDCWLEEDFILFLWNEEEERQRIEKMPQRTSMLRGHMYIWELLSGPHPGNVHTVFRLERPTFLLLCDTLRENNLIKQFRGVQVEESVAIFLYIVCQELGMRVAADRFQHSLETISRHFKVVMRALCRLGKTLLTPQPINGVHPHVRYNRKYYPWFEKCIGAIDGTQVSARTRAITRTRFRNRKARLSQNVLAICDFDMRFTFVYAGWEGSAHDSRVFYDAISRPENKFPLPPDGYYYVVDAGFPLMKGFLPPYKGHRYHLSRFSGVGGTPRGKKELFNYNHSSLRNVIERCFGMLKNRFPVLEKMPRYLPTRQPSVVIACCTLHNFCRIHQPTDAVYRGFCLNEQIVQRSDNFRHDLTDLDVSTAAARQMGRERDVMAQRMWTAQG